MPRVSVVIPAYDAAPFVGATLASLRAQSFTDWEAWVIDDGSRDETVAVAEAAADGDGRIHVVGGGANAGPAAARNRGIERAGGRYLAFLDADDLWAPAKLERQLALMTETAAPLAYTGYTKFAAGEAPDGARRVHVPDSVDYATLLDENVIACSSAMADREAVGEVRFPAIAKRQDFGLWLQLLRPGRVARGLDEPLMHLRKRPDSVSGNKLVAAAYTWRVYRQVEGLGLASSLRHFGCYAWRSYRKSRI